jgi:hypothetical protein
MPQFTHRELTFPFSVLRSYAYFKFLLILLESFKLSKQCFVRFFVHTLCLAQLFYSTLELWGSLQRPTWTNKNKLNWGCLRYTLSLEVVFHKYPLPVRQYYSTYNFHWDPFLLMASSIKGIFLWSWLLARSFFWCYAPFKVIVYLIFLPLRSSSSERSSSIIIIIHLGHLLIRCLVLMVSHFIGLTVLQSSLPLMWVSKCNANVCCTNVLCSIVTAELNLNMSWEWLYNW